MRKELLLIFAAFFIMSLTALSGVYAGETQDKETMVSEEKIDVTGDGKKDTVFLKATRSNKEGQFLKNLYMEVHASNSKTYKMTLNGGYQPKASYRDFDHDGINDILFTITTGESGGAANFQLSTFKRNKLTKLNLPDPLTISSKFAEGYKAAISIAETGQSYTFDLADRKKDYELIGLYQDGKLNQPTELQVMPFDSLKPAKIDGKGLGMVGTQRVNGVFTGDGIALIESEWYYERGKWNLVITRVKSVRAGNI